MITALLSGSCPYETAEYRDNEDAHNYYDEVEVCGTWREDTQGSTPKVNREMVDRSDLVVFFVERETGGAYQTMRYAEKNGNDISTLPLIQVIVT